MGRHLSCCARAAWLVFAPMPDLHNPEPAQRLGPFAALFGWVLGAALQLQQGALWPVWGYAPLALMGFVSAAWLWRSRWRVHWRWRAAAWAFAFATLAFASSGLRSLAFEAGALPPALEGQDLHVVGVVTDLPQRNEAGLRFTLAVESATLNGQPAALPALVDVGWYADTSQPGDVRAGERWSFTLRPKAPHGSRNPFGFDYELWLWERGVQATTYVRGGSGDAAPQRLGQTGRHPVALLRQMVRERIYAAVEQRQVAGLVAALVVGDQAAIDGLGQLSSSLSLIRSKMGEIS